MICKKDHRYLNEYNSLPEAQDNQHGDRHICAGCRMRKDYEMVW